MKTPFYIIRRAEPDSKGRLIRPEYLHFADKGNDDFTCDVSDAKAIKSSVEADTELEACRAKNPSYDYRKLTINP